MSSLNQIVIIDNDIDQVSNNINRFEIPAVCIKLSLELKVFIKSTANLKIQNERDKTERKRKMQNIFTNSKCGIVAILTLCILLGIAGTCVYAASMSEESTVATLETTQEFMPVLARACSYIHYSVNGYYGNGYVKSVTYTTYYNGIAINTETVDYPESGDESMSSFAGCKCPMCN